MSNQRTKQALSRLAEFVTKELGIRMPASKHAMLEGRLTKRMRALQINSVASYENHLTGEVGQVELQQFYDAVTTNKTQFFREARHFDYLREAVLDPYQGRNFRVWCAGCSTGEEGYTLAMVLSEHAARHAGFQFSITATDISARALELARRATYPADAVEAMPLELRKRYLLRSKDPTQELVKIAPELREQVRFARLNFMDASYQLGAPFQAVFFRNVLIYFDKPTQQQVVQRICRHLEPGGHLFVSHSESLTDLDLPLQPVSQAVYRKVS